jgi:hypothetical protein
VIEALQKFTPILIDGPNDREPVRKYSVHSYPHTIFADAKGAAVKEISDYVETKDFLAALREAAKKIKPGKPSKEYATLTSAKAQLDGALPRRQVVMALDAIAKIEKINRPGPILDAALAAKKQLLEDGAKRLDAAKAAVKGDKKDEALKELKTLAQDYRGTDVGTEAARLVRELDPDGSPR